MQNPIAPDPIWIEQRVLAVHMADALAKRLDHLGRIDALPPKMTGIEIDADIVVRILGERLETLAAEYRNAGMKLKTHHQSRCLFGQAPADRLPERSHFIFHLPAENVLVVGRCGPAWKHTERSAAQPCRTATHGDDPINSEIACQGYRRVQAALRVGALARVGMKDVACSVYRRKAYAVFGKLVLEALAFTRLRNCINIEMRARPWAPCAESQFDISQSTLRTPGEELPA